MCVVTSVIVGYTKHEKEHVTSYIVKLNSCRSAHMDALSKIIFQKEIGFYQTLVPMLNAELKRAGQPNLRFPKYFYYAEKECEEVLYLEDLRNYGYKMIDRHQGLDSAHCELVLEELARLHAASSLLISREEYLGIDIVKKLPFLQESFTAIDEENTGIKLKNLFGGVMETGAVIAGSSLGYENVEKYLNANKTKAADILLNQFHAAEHFKVICHGDCWSNNFLFR